MDSEYHIIDERTPYERAAEEFGERIGRRRAEMERQRKLVKRELSMIDMIIGVLMQTRGCLSADNDISDQIEDHLGGMLDTVNDMVSILNDRSKEVN